MEETINSTFRPLIESWYMKSKQKYWFKRRRYGYGWIPTSWQGAVTLIIFLLVVAFSSIYFLKDVKQATYPPELGMFLLVLSISMFVVIRISYKMGPPPKWRWGSKPSDDPELDF